MMSLNYFEEPEYEEEESSKVPLETKSQKGCQFLIYMMEK